MGQFIIGLLFILFIVLPIVKGAAPTVAAAAEVVMEEIEESLK